MMPSSMLSSATKEALSRVGVAVLRSTLVNDVVLHEVCDGGAGKVWTHSHLCTVAAAAWGVPARTAWRRRWSTARAMYSPGPDTWWANSPVHERSRDALARPLAARAKSVWTETQDNAACAIAYAACTIFFPHQQTVGERGVW